MKMRDDEVAVVDMNIDCEGGEKKTSHSADRKEANESERVKHRRLK